MVERELVKDFLKRYEILIAFLAAVGVYVVYYSYPPYGMPLMLSQVIWIAFSIYAIFSLYRIFVEAKAKRKQHLLRAVARMLIYASVAMVGIMRTNGY